MKFSVLPWHVLYLLVAIFAVVDMSAAQEGESSSYDLTNVNIQTPRYRANPNGFSLPLGTYTYRIGWQGIPAAHATVDVIRDGDSVRIITSVKTLSAIDFLYKLRYRAEGVLDSQTLYPQRTVIDQRENSRTRRTEITFAPNGDIHSVRANKGQRPKIIDFNSNNFTIDPFSAAFIARSLDWNTGQARQFDTFNGKTRYLITLASKGRRLCPGDEKGRYCFVIVPTVKNVVSKKNNEKLRRAEILVSDDERRDIVQINSQVFIGSVATELVEFRPALLAAFTTAQAATETLLK